MENTKSRANGRQAVGSESESHADSKQAKARANKGASSSKNCKNCK